MRRLHHSGIRAREWRIGLSDDHENDLVRTLKFRLEPSSLDSDLLSAAKTLYATTRGAGEKSLMGFACILHLGGFRFFGNAAKALEYRQKTTPTANLSGEDGTLAFDPQGVAGNNNSILSAVNSGYMVHAVVAHLSSLASQDKDKNQTIAKKVKELFCDGQANAFSWVFGKGLQKFKSYAPDDLMRDYGISEEHRNIAKLIIESAKKIPEDSLFQNQNYSRYRRTVQGGIHGWISNYAKRIEELQEKCGKVLEGGALELPKEWGNCPELFDGTGTNFHDLDLACKKIRDLARKTKKSLDVLSRGNGNNNVEKNLQDVEIFNDALASVAGTWRQIKNNIDQNDRLNKEQKKYLKKKPPEWLKELPKIPKFTGGAIPDIQEEIKNLGKDYSESLARMRRHHNRLRKKYPFDTLAIFKERERQFSNNASEEALHRQAVRQIFHRFLKKAQTVQDELKREVAEFIMQKYWISGKRPRKITNDYLFNKKGQFYIHPRAQRRHEPLPLAFDKINASKLVDQLEGFADRLVNEHFQNISYLRDVLELQRACISLRLSGLKNEIIPVADANPGIPESLLRMPPLLKILLQTGKPVSAEAFLKLFNLHFSVLSGLTSRICRRSFITRMTFRRDNTNESLYYVPKNKEWTPPRHIFNTDNPLKRALEKIGVREGEGISARDALSRAYEQYKSNWAPHMELSAFLQQCPHDWMYDGGKMAAGQTVDRAFKVQPHRKNTPFEKPQQTQSLFRLVGPASYKTVLDQGLKGKEYLKLGTAEFCIEQHYNQKAVFKNGNLQIEISKPHIQLWVHIVPYEKYLQNRAAGNKWMNRCLAIDMGEYGIGYALFDVKTGKQCYDSETGELISGTQGIPAIRRLIKRVDKYRRLQQPAQKFHTTAGSKLQKIRENVVGDTLNVINTLLAKYNAFPVFENSVGNFEQGGNQLKLVYKSVLSYYLYGENDAQNQKRQQYWGTKKAWKHPYLIKYKGNWNYDNVKDYNYVKSGNEKELSLFPGTGVAPAFTSLRCATCDRNPVLAIRNNEQKEYKLKDGVTRLSNGNIRLYKRPSGKVGKKTPHQTRSAWTDPVEDKIYKMDDLEKLIKRNLRRPPQSLQSPDTTQSRYHCVYTDCLAHKHNHGNGVHADENAAINIGKKFWKMVEVKRN